MKQYTTLGTITCKSLYMYRIVSVCCWILPIHSLLFDKGTKHGSWKHVGGSSLDNLSGDESTKSIHDLRSSIDFGMKIGDDVFLNRVEPLRDSTETQLCSCTEEEASCMHSEMHKARDELLTDFGHNMSHSFNEPRTLHVKIEGYPPPPEPKNWHATISFVCASLLAVSEVLPYYSKYNGIIHAMTEIQQAYKDDYKP